MKKFKILIALIVVTMSLQFNMVFAKEYTEIETVAITGIDYPYSTGSMLDTTAIVSNSSKSIVTEVSWSSADNDLYKVTVLLKPFINYEYTENTTATVNGKRANNILVKKDGNLEVSYVFEKDESISIPNSSNTLTHVIMVYSSNNGKITPDHIRAPHNKNFTVQIIPDEGYEVKDVVVDGESVGAVTEYTFRRVKETHKIKAYFKEVEKSKEDVIASTILHDMLIELFKAIF